MSATPTRPGSPGPRPSPPAVLFVDDDVHVLESMRALLRSRPYELLVATSGREALDILGRRPVAVIVSDEHMPQMRGGELLREVRRRHPGITRLVLSGSTDARAIADAVNRAGVFRYLLKPCAPDDLMLAVDQALEAHTRPLSDATGPDLDVDLDAVLQRLDVHLQPIFRTHDRQLFAHEALLRVAGDEIVSPGRVLATAERQQRLWEVDRTIRRRVAERIADRAPGTAMFVNLHPASLLDADLFSSTGPLAADARSVVFELTERSGLLDIPDLTARIETLRALGYRVAVDDLGSGYSGLNTLAIVMPDFVKIDQELVRAVHTDATRRTLIASLTAACTALGIASIAEGVEDERDLTAVGALGCEFVQGYLLGRPGPAFQGAVLARR